MHFLSVVGFEPTASSVPRGGGIEKLGPTGTDKHIDVQLSTLEWGPASDNGLDNGLSQTEADRQLRRTLSGDRSAL